MMHYHRALCLQYSCIIIILLITISGFLSLIIIFVLKPRRPIFSFQTMKVDSYKFDVSDSSTVFLSLVAYVTLISQNPNRVGIRYDFSKLKILNNGLVVGMIRIPEFYQPARSQNVSIQIDVLCPHLDISTIMSGVNTNSFPIEVSGDIGIHLWVLHIKLPRIKVGLHCDVAIDWRYLISTHEKSSLKAVKNPLALFDANSQAFSKKCSLDFHV